MSRSLDRLPAALRPARLALGALALAAGLVALPGAEPAGAASSRYETSFPQITDEDDDYTPGAPPAGRFESGGGPVEGPRFDRPARARALEGSRELEQRCPTAEIDDGRPGEEHVFGIPRVVERPLRSGLPTRPTESPRSSMAPISSSQWPVGHSLACRVVVTCTRTSGTSKSGGALPSSSAKKSVST